MTGTGLFAQLGVLMLPLTRRLSRARMRRPDGTPYETLVVADVDLDRSVATVLPTCTAPHRAPEGVHALVWHHGEPIGQLTRAGDWRELLLELPALAQERFRPELVEHQLRDALATGLDAVAAHGLDAVPHPAASSIEARHVTVAVCTRDRPDDLRMCLTAIGALTAEVAEVLVIDNASADDRTRKVAEEFPFVRYVREPRQGLDWARNRALLEAGTPVVAFTDDDALVHPRWVEGVVRAFGEEPAAVVITGLVVPAELATPAQVLFESGGGFSKGFRRRWFASGEGEVAAARHATIGGAGTGANMAVRRQPALALGGFDPALDVGTPTGGGGDLEFFFRVVAAGHLLVYEPSAVVRHRHRQTIEGLRRQRRGDGTGAYTWLLGAGRRYGRRQFAAFLRFAVRWAVVHHLRIQIVSTLLPKLMPPLAIRAETRGAIDAITGQYYLRAQRMAQEQAALHPEQPTAPPLVHTPAVRRSFRGRAPVVTVDLAQDGCLADGRRWAMGTAAAVTVQVLRNGAPPLCFAVETHGSGLSSARLRWEIAARLRPEQIGVENLADR